VQPHESLYQRQGFGVSAHSFNGHERYANERDTAKYVERVEQLGGAEVLREGIDEASETAFLGLRLNEGIDLDEYESRFGIFLRDRTPGLLENGLVDIDGGRLRLTRKGMLFSNEVFAEFL
jgi:oxygen-independent coproporphyrinogen-3 oxidase